jgi:hypothetical protein
MVAAALRQIGWKARPGGQWRLRGSAGRPADTRRIRLTQQALHRRGFTLTPARTQAIGAHRAADRPPRAPPHEEDRMTHTTPPTEAPESSVPGTSIAQVIAFIVDRATLANLEPLHGACTDRDAALRAQRARTIEPGHTVKIVDIKPAWMKGMTGTVQSIDHTTRKPRAQVRLDARSTDEARWSTTIPEGATSHLVRVPLSCLAPYRCWPPRR